MFYYVSGTVAEMEAGLAVIDCGGVGFACYTTNYSLAHMKKGSQAKMFTYLNVKEDGMDLYGFTSQAELRSFKLLLGVNGVGPKAALSILSSTTPDQLAMCVVMGDEKTLTAAPGIGKKIAQRIILELKDKLSNAQFNQLIANIDAIHDLAQSVETDMTKAESDVTDEYQNQIDALDQILQYTEDLIRAEADERIDAIKDEIDAYKEIIKLKKESLRQTKEENSYQQDVSDKIKEITELQAKADLLSMDSSRSASAERQKLLQEISQLQQDLADAQSDYAYDLQTEALEKEAEAYEESRQPEIDAIEESVSSTEKVYQLAIARIRDQWDTLYEDLIAWNTEQGSVINQEITDNWELACKAVAKYGSYVEALAGLEGDMNPTSDGRLVVADIPKYHGGGVAGDKGRLNDEEVLAVLQKGELVVDKQQKNGLFTIIDFVQELGRRLGAKISGLRNLSMTEAIAPNLVGATPTTSDITNNNSIVFNPQFNVTISGGEMNSANARSFGEELAETAANSLFERFNARGINIVKRLRQ